MNTFLLLTAFLSLVYPTFSLINQHLHLATPLYPLWQWALALAWPALASACRKVWIEVDTPLTRGKYTSDTIRIRTAHSRQTKPALYDAAVTG